MPEVNYMPPSLSYRPADPAQPVLDISIGDALRAATSTWRTRTALIDGTSEEQTRRRWTFEELLTESENAARGAFPDLREVIALSSWPEFLKSGEAQTAYCACFICVQLLALMT
jgi:hypothetical protein